MTSAPAISKVPDPCIMVIFGATGDLTSRKLMPALYNLAKNGQLPSNFACVAFARRDKTDEQFRQEMFDAVNQFSREKPVDEAVWKAFSSRLFYHRSEFHEDAGYESLNHYLNTLDQKFQTQGNRVYYLSTQPSFFPLIVEHLYRHGLIYNHAQTKEKWSRVIVEKPFGHDLLSALSLQKELVQYLDESQIYRIDHYLGKETVQNLLMFRFSNPIFESIWNNHHIDHVEITVAEAIGIGTRGRLWEEAGMLRDIVQNHMMQLLTLVGMEPPSSFKARAIHDEKVKVMESIRPFPVNAIDSVVTRGQYGPGIVQNEQVKGYRQEDNVSPTSNVETFVALQLFIDNWRWMGVPFFLRAGKRMPKRVTEIAITFKNAPGFLFGEKSRPAPNILTIRIQPDEGISLKMNCKVPGPSSPVQPVKMDFQYESYFGAHAPEAYERLLCDCMSGDSTLFARVDEVFASWRLFTPILDYWAATEPHDFPNYSAGTWGPKKAEELPARYGYTWKT